MLPRYSTNRKDDLGLRCESIFAIEISRFHNVQGALFRPRFLGDKQPRIDFIVELASSGPTVPFFFVQVRGTELGYVGRRGRLRVAITAGDVADLARYPAPTYLVGIDHATERAFLASANGEATHGASSMTTDFPLNTETRLRLWEEVNSYWNIPESPKLRSQFVDPFWR